MRIGLVIYGRLDTLTGGYLYDRFLVEALRERGHRVEVISLDLKSYPARLLDNFSRRPAGRLTGRNWDLMLQDALCHPSLIRLNHRVRRGRRPAIVAIVHQVLCRQPRPRLVNRVYGWAEKTYYRSVDGALFASRFTRDAARAFVRADAPLRVVPPAGDRLGCIPSVRAVFERSRQAGPLKLLFVGNLSPVKGLDRLLECLARLPPNVWHLAVAGSLTMDRKHARRIQELIARFGLGSQVSLMGAVNGEPLRALYLGAHLFAMPFAHEGFGIAALEAMAFGLPVIGSAEGGVREFVRHAHNGFLAAARDDEAVIRHIALLHHNRDLLAAMSQAALQTLSERPGWERTMRCGCDFLERVAGSPRRCSDAAGGRRT
jgi:glycosyltransferase involved in cell wall biosynthesis